jgi:hypothetical protein
MGDWVHEILVTLHLKGKRFEVIPDLLMNRSLREASFEVFRLGHLMRSLEETMFGYVPGSDQSLLTRLAIDAGLRDERSLANAEYMRALSERLGRPIAGLGLDVLGGEHRARLAAVAHASGQVALATDLLGSTVQNEAAKNLSIDDYIRREANVISLVRETTAGRFSTLNLDEPHSFRFEPAKLSLTLHANAAHKGIGGIQYADIDLSKIRRFACRAQIMENANPIRFRVELRTLDQSQRWTGMHIVEGGADREWEIELPDAVRARCWAMIAVEMADITSASTNAFATWIDPRFTP